MIYKGDNQMLNESMIEIIKEKGLETIECNSIEEFIDVLKILENIEGEIPGIEISAATEDDDLNEGESLRDLESGVVSHYCAKTVKGEKFINNDKLESWANDYFIAGDGKPDRKNISIMDRNGFLVYPGEADCFGWLTGVLETKIGKVVFG